MTRKIDRRTVVRGAGVTLALPWLEAMTGPRTAAAAGTLPAGFYSPDGFPKRLLIVYSANGVILDRWKPVGTETSFTLGPSHEPLAPFKAKLLVSAGGILNIGGQKGPGDAHQNGIGAMLTGTTLTKEALFGVAGAAQVGWANGISVDQAVADRVASQTRLRSLELGVQVPAATNWSRMSYRGPSQPVSPENSPFAAFDRLFMGGGVAAPDTALRDRRKVVLDAVRENYRTLTARVGAADRLKLQAHIASMDDVLRQLDSSSAPATTGTCTGPALGTPFDVNAPDRFPDIARLQIKIMAQALACDLTRVGSIMFDRARGEKLYSWLGHTRTHHDISHYGETDTASMAQMAQINRWHAEQVALLLGELDRVKEGNGTVLDHTLVVWCNEITIPNNHNEYNAPYVFAGSCGGAVRTGRAVLHSGTNNDLHLAILNVMGIDQKTFGEPAFCKGPLVGLS
jgi:hypothetical protein